jgi:hypothetical protein
MNAENLCVNGYDFARTHDDHLERGTRWTIGFGQG